MQQKDRQQLVLIHLVALKREKNKEPCKICSDIKDPRLHPKLLLKPFVLQIGKENDSMLSGSSAIFLTVGGT